jgi:hypothetical protein
MINYRAYALRAAPEKRVGALRPSFSSLAWLWSLFATAIFASSAAGQAKAKECEVRIGWSSEGQFIQDEACGIHQVAKEKGFFDLELSGSKKYQFRFRANNVSTKDEIVRRVGYVCELIGSKRAVFSANRGRERALIVSFSCDDARG